MLEGSSNELAVLSQPSSPRHPSQFQHQASLPVRPGPGAWLPSSSAISSRAATPRATAAAAVLSSLAPLQQQPSRFSRAASLATLPDSTSLSLPSPAWPAEAAAGRQPACDAQQGVKKAPAAVAQAPCSSSDEEQQDRQQWAQPPQVQEHQHTSQEALAAEPSIQGKASPRCGSTVSLSGWQPPLSSAAASSSSQEPAPLAPQQQLGMVSDGSDTLPVAAAWASRHGAAAAASAALAGVSHLEQHQQDSAPGLRPPLGGSRSSPRSGNVLSGCRSGHISGSVTPRLGSLSNLGPGASLPPPDSSPLVVAPRAPSVRLQVRVCITCCDMPALIPAQYSN